MEITLPSKCCNVYPALYSQQGVCSYCGIGKLHICVSTKCTRTVDTEGRYCESCGAAADQERARVTKVIRTKQYILANTTTMKGGRKEDLVQHQLTLLQDLLNEIGE
jgi:hypothetical protein